MDTVGLEPVAESIRDHVRAASGGVVVVGVAGPVCVGKTTLSERLRTLLTPVTTEIVSTDGFLFPNHELARRDLTTRKGFPESYDTEAIVGFLGAVRHGPAGLRVPLYSHLTYDVVDEEQVLADAAVVIVEGVNALQFTDALDLAVYLDAPEGAIEAWYTERLVRKFATAPPGSFYATLGFDEAMQRAFAHDVWVGINRPNLAECILPTRDRASIVVEKDADHSVRRVRYVGLSS
jgi:type I pantothenate kinase